MSVDEIRREAREIFDNYDANFAGKPRATRDLELLDRLIEELEEVLKRARSKLNGGENEALVSVIEQGSENLEIYRTERRAIREVKQGGRGPVRASRLATWANVEFHRYRRHFAGQNRATRDLEMLHDIVESLKDLRDQMETLDEKEDVEGLEDDIETVRENLDRYGDERERIVQARRNGTLEERVSYLAATANTQFELYRALFAGKSRLTRRPALLRRMIRTLKNVKRKMENLQEEAPPGDENEKNIAIVEENLETYREELEAIEEARSSVDAAQRTGELGDAANDVFETYRAEYSGEDRATRDLDQLGRMCDELYHIARQMQRLGEREGLETNEENLSIVLENLSLYQTEYDEIEQLQGRG